MSNRKNKIDWAIGVPATHPPLKLAVAYSVWIAANNYEHQNKLIRINQAIHNQLEYYHGKKN